MRFVQEHPETGICVFSGEDMFMMTVLHKQVTDLSGENPTEAYRLREGKEESLAQQICFVCFKWLLKQDGL
jgi:hypothetical protein